MLISVTKFEKKKIFFSFFEIDSKKQNQNRLKWKKKLH